MGPQPDQYLLGCGEVAQPGGESGGAGRLIPTGLPPPRWDGSPAKFAKGFGRQAFVW